MAQIENTRREILQLDKLCSLSRHGNHRMYLLGRHNFGRNDENRRVYMHDYLFYLCAYDGNFNEKP